MSLDVHQIRKAFPVLDQEVNGHPLVYLDSAATALTPEPVVEAIARYYREDCANVHRSVHTLSARATETYEQTRAKVKAFLNVPETHTVVFGAGTTHAINLVAHSLGAIQLQSGDVVAVTQMEHHANLVPWQLIAEQQGASLRVIPVGDDGSLAIADVEAALTPDVKVLAFPHISNVLGTVVAAKEVIGLAQSKGIPVLVDGAQAVPRVAVDMHDLDPDFYVFSSHKVCGPTGLGVLVARTEWLERMPPFFGGGDMIETVNYERSTYNVPPYKFEAGTPPIAQAYGLSAAIDFMSAIGMDPIDEHERHLLTLATEALTEIPGLRILGTAPGKAAVVTFDVPGAHPNDLATLMDLGGVAVRTGHHCAQPLLRRFGLESASRASFAFYNTEDDVMRFVARLQRALTMCEAA